MTARPRVLAAAAALIVALPALVTAMPPLLDYPNHLTRFWLESGGVEAVARFYAVDWSRTASNLVMDLIAAAIGVAASANIAGHVVLILSALAPPLGAALVSRRLFGRWSFWQVWCGLVAWPLALLTGFMSLELAFGAALSCLWLDLRLVEQGPWTRLARQSAQVLLILLIHPFGAMFYGLLAFGVWLGPDLRVWRRRPARAALGGFGLLIAPFVIAASLLVARILLFKQGDGADLGLPRLSWYDPPLSRMGPDHLFWGFIAPLRSYQIGVDLVFIALLWTPVMIAAVQKRLSAHGGLAATGLCLFAFSLICPQGVGDTSMVDLRLASMALLILPVAVLPRLDDGARLRRLLPVLALIALAGRSAWLTTVWEMRQADVRAVQSALSPAPAGARLMPLAARDDDAPQKLGRELGGMTPTWSHLDALAVMRRRVYTPTLFAEAGKQPLRVLPPFDADNEASGGLLATPADLAAGHDDAAAYLPNWRGEFDYILLLNAEGPPPALTGARLVRDAGFAKLYRVDPSR